MTPSAPKWRETRTALELRPVFIGDLPRSEAGAIWKRIERQSWFLDDSTKDPYTLAAILAAPTSRVFLLGDPPQGLFYAFNVLPEHSAGVAGVIWGRAAAGRSSLALDGMRAVAIRDKVHRFYANVAAPNVLGHRFCTSLGMTPQGRIIEALCYSGVWTDTVVYGVLAREL